MYNIKGMRGEMKELLIKLQDHDEAQAVLVKDVERLQGATSRSAYTDRIMDILRNLGKQKVEIERILADISENQKKVFCSARQSRLASSSAHSPTHPLPSALSYNAGKHLDAEGTAIVHRSG